MARVLYTTLLALLTPFALAWLALRARRQTGAPDAWRERLGKLAERPAGRPLWVHAASLGEVRAAHGLIDELLSRDSTRPVLITTFSATARRHCLERYGGRATVANVPYDLPLFVQRFLRGARPRLAVFIETELWPNLYRAIGRHDIPVVIASARLSARSYERYARFRSLIAPCLRQAARIGAQTHADADRFIALGAAAERVSVIGNLKFDAPPPPEVVAQGDALRHELFGDRPVWVAGSTREGEEAIVLEAFRRVRERSPSCALVLAPRHPERAASLAGLARARGLDATLRSASAARPYEAPVLIVDGVGELVRFYAAADVAFVGGTLVAIGGHNILEPAMLARPIVAGPHLESWRALAPELVRVGGLVIAADAAALADAVNRLLFDAEARAAAGAGAKHCVEQNRGALERALRLVESALSEDEGGFGRD
jgi:3-deoxy-D-manno-octulosonic-acid transferase